MNLLVPHIGFQFEYLGIEMTIIQVFHDYVTVHYVDKLGRIHGTNLGREYLVIITKLEIFKRK
jgi:hypothetical protein